MSKKKKQIEEFFSAYQSHFNRGLASDDSDVSKKITSFFAPCFVESGPSGVICGKNDTQFLERIGEGFAFYKSIGSTGMNIISKDITLIDEFHALARIYWRYSYSKDNLPGTIDFNTTYVVSLLEGEVKIFAYMTGDEHKALREKGLIPEQKAEPA